MNRLALSWVDAALEAEAEAERWRQVATALLFLIFERSELAGFACAEVERRFQEER